MKQRKNKVATQSAKRDLSTLLWLRRLYIKYIHILLIKIGGIPTDRTIEEDRKYVLVFMAFFCVIMGIFHAITYVILNQFFHFQIAMLYVIVCLASMGILSVTKWYMLFSFSYSLATILYVFVLALFLDTRMKAGSLFIFSLMITVSAGVIQGRKRAIFYIFLHTCLFVFLSINDTYGIVYKEGAPSDTYLWINPVFVGINILSLFVVLLGASTYIHRKNNFYKNQSDILLNNTFPPLLVRRIKKMTKTDNIFSEYRTDTSVLFANISGFSTAAERMSAQKLITMLNEVFSRMDVLCEIYKIEKIKTLGDGYMAMAEPVEDEDSEYGGNHAQRIVQFAIESLKSIRDITVNNVPLRLRVGIHSGPVISGVIGIDRLTYDIWGSTVNIAAHIVNHTSVGCITISDATYNKINNWHSFENKRVVHMKDVDSLTLWDVVT